MLFRSHVKCQLDEAQTGIKLAGRNINNLRYVNDTTLMAESDELKSLLMKAKEEEIGSLPEKEFRIMIEK